MTDVPVPLVTGMLLKYKRSLSVPKGVRAPTPRMVILLVLIAPDKV